MRSVLITILVFACGAPQVRSEHDLSESIRVFNEGVRWERFAVAATSIPPAQRSQFVDEMDQRASDLKITDYEIVNLAPRGDREAHVQIKLSWYKASEGTVHETHAIQTWERHGKIWLMVDETRLRGAEMPGLSDPSWSEQTRSADRFRSTAKPGSDSPHGEGPPRGGSLCGEGPPCGESVMKD